MNVLRGAGASPAGRCDNGPGHGRGHFLSSDGTKAIVVTGTGFCHPAALCYYAPLLRRLDPAELHTLDRWGLGFIQRSVDRLVRRLEELDAPATLIGHSQGGLVAALALETASHLLSQVVTVCAPLGGTAWTSAWWPIPSAREMSRARRSEHSWLTASKMVNIVASNDRVVVPYRSGLVAGAEHHVISGVGHSGIIWDARLHRLVGEVVRRPSVGGHRGHDQVDAALPVAAVA
jgi:pimeloyl-ACP methyl ester carboxylesterase